MSTYAFKFHPGFASVYYPADLTSFMFAPLCPSTFVHSFKFPLDSAINYKLTLLVVVAMMP